MPDAIITSTESTFGTISGTFAADQSTISGTILGPVAGNLSGSVGVPGPAGPGVPAGGTAGQILQKIDGVDYNTDWVTVNFSATWGNITGTLSSQTDLQTALDGKYSTSNPAGYITSSALSPYLTSATAASTYQTLAGMSSYLTTSAAAAGYYPLTGNPSGFLTASSLSGYATESWVTGQGYITSAALTGYATESFVTSQGYITSSALTGYATESWVTAGFYPLASNPAGYLTSASLSGYALLSGATFTGTLSAPTPSPGTDSTVVATTEWVKDLDYAPLNSPQFVGNPRGPTPSLSDNDTSLATTEFVKGQGYITSAALSPYLLSSTAASTYQTIAGMSSYLTTSAAASTYYPLTNPSGYITSSALAGYATESWVTAGFYPLSSNPAGYLTSASLSGYATESWVTSELGSYLTTSTAASTYAPLASPALTGNPTAPTPATADNDTSIATTAFVKAQGYLTSAPVTSVAGKTGAVTLVVGDVSGAAPLASPTFTGTPAAPTATAGTNTTQIATTAFVTAGLNLKANLASPTFTGTPAAPTASAGTSTTQLATTAFVTTADNLKANLASPAFTGTPTAPTATAGTNTTQIATTAFVQQEVPAASTTAAGKVELATLDEAILGSSTTLAPTAFSAKAAIMSADWMPVPRAGFTATTSGTGAACTLGWTNTFYQLPTSGSSGHSYARTFGLSQVDQLTNLWGDDANIYVNFAKRIWISGRSLFIFPAITNMIARVSLGKAEASGVGDLAVRGIGWKYTTGSSQFVQLMVHNGTTLTTVNSSFTPSNVPFDWDIVSEGNGNVTLYINGSSVATTSAGPSTRATSGQCLYQEEAVVNGTIPNAYCRLYCARGAIYVQR